jgi:gamma-glutamyltranspeptidase/glutathione hydrolase
MSRRAYRILPTDATSFHPRLFGTRGAVASNSNLSAGAGADMLKAGGNAIDAAVAASFVEGLVNPQMHTIGGECPLLVRPAGGRRVYAVNGNMAAPQRATPGEYRARGLSDVPDSGILAAGVPAAFGALVTALRRWGTMPLNEVIAPAIALAKNGFPVSDGLRNQHRFGIAAMEARFRKKWAGSAKLYLPGGRMPEVGQLMRNQALSRTFDYVSRSKNPLEAFYKGEIAKEIARYSKERDGLLAYEDLKKFETKIEKPVSLKLGGTELFKTGFWSQGPAELQTLALLWQFDLKKIGFGTADYCHLLIEAMKLAYADREQYYGDTKVPGEILLSTSYVLNRKTLIDMTRASVEFRPGDAWKNEALLPENQKLTPKDWGAGTVHVDAVDAKGNMASFTPSGAWIMSAEVIPVLGFPLSTRMMTFYLEPPNHPNVIAPGKRPRTTLSPSMAFRNGRPWMAFGTMGGDNQGQWLLQFYLCRAAFGMTIPEAIEAPRLSSEHTPGFFAPHAAEPNRVRIEPRFGETVLDELRRRGHDLDIAPDWTEGFVSCAERDGKTGLIEAGCDPRGAKAECFPSAVYCW